MLSAVQRDARASAFGATLNCCRRPLERATSISEREMSQQEAHQPPVDAGSHGPYAWDDGRQISESHAQARGAETGEGGRKAEKQCRELQGSSED